MKKSSKKVKSNTDIQRAEANDRINAFNNELKVLAEKYQVKLDVSQRIVIVDNKTSK